MLARTFFLAAMGLVLQVAAAPGSTGSLSQLKREECSDGGMLLLSGCKPGQETCEFCCPPGFNANQWCHAGHGANSCQDAGWGEWHCDAHAKKQKRNAVPETSGSGLQLKRQSCIAPPGCSTGHDACEFCCPPDVDPTTMGEPWDECHLGHEPYNCEGIDIEWHCDHDEHKRKRSLA
ncbi:hypothetical protein N656DRAFT_779459 [Canariomyces notabilis]|uniref:Uncharacterized protein n=1 Tax=Canariomyces notabilis TaxID=2074819 RepID=A0AAN6YS68_9PEZI|nr:hypothetical protein N656DRAFT_779459 [Canariomyces arenarius]